MGLDVTHQVLSTEDRVDRIRALDNPVADRNRGYVELLSIATTPKSIHRKGAPLHDPCTVAWLLQPDLFDGKDCNISIETESELTMGHTAVDFWHVTDKPINATWISFC